MTHRVRAGWLSFRRIHLAALIADWHRTLLSVIGVAVGVTVAGLTPVDVAGGSHGFFLLGGSCQIELLVGSFNCEQRARDVKPAAGPGVPLQIPAVIAQRHGLQLGDELRIPGLPPGSAHLGWTFPEFDRVEGINGGYVLLAPSMDIAASMLGSPGYATVAFVLPRRGTDITAVAVGVDRVIAGVATAGPPRPHLPAVFESATQSFNLTVLAGVLIGLLIAVNTILLAVEDRRTSANSRPQLSSTALKPGETAVARY